MNGVAAFRLKKSLRDLGDYGIMDLWLDKRGC